MDREKQHRLTLVGFLGGFGPSALDGLGSLVCVLPVRAVSAA